MKIKCRNHYHDGNTIHLVIKTMNNRGCLRRRKTKVTTSFLVIHEKKNKQNQKQTGKSALMIGTASCSHLPLTMGVDGS